MRFVIPFYIENLVMAALPRIETQNMRPEPAVSDALYEPEKIQGVRSDR
jgi:hypothetical protein